MTDTPLSKDSHLRKKAGYHHGDLRNAILEAVASLIAKNRSLDFQLKDVAEMVGTSTPAIYRHFESKQNLLVETAIAGYETQKQYRSVALERSDPLPLARLLAVGHAYIRYARAHPGHYLLIKSMETEEILSSRRYQQLRRETVRLMRSLTRECLDTGVFVKRDMDLILASLQMMAFGIAHLFTADQLRYVAPSLMNDEDLVTNLLRLNIGSLLSAKGKRQVDAASRDPFNDFPE